jgi:hypothetical protein
MRLTHAVDLHTFLCMDTFTSYYCEKLFSFFFSFTPSTIYTLGRIICFFIGCFGSALAPIFEFTESARSFALLSEFTGLKIG